MVDIQIIEKIGRRNLPILQEEDTFRIFGKIFYLMQYTVDKS